MKKSLLIFGFLLTISSIGIIGCKKKKDEPTPVPAPVAAFSYTGAGANAPANVAFTNSSTNATSYNWDFGDGGTSTEVNPTHTYTVAGTFNVKLKATGSGGTNEITKSLTINAPTVMPVANFTYTGAGGNAPCTVTFTNTSQNAVTYSWDFGDNGTSTTESPSHIYTTGGTFTVTLIATNANGSNTIQKTVNVLGPVGPSAHFTYSGAGGYAPCTVTFTNTSTNATSYSWTFGDGGTSTATSPSHQYTSGGTFTVQLTATGPGGTNSYSQTVNILSPPTNAYIKKITVSAMPFINGSGSGWDISNGPDVYFDIEDFPGTIYYNYNTADIYSDVTSGSLPISWSFAAPYFHVPDINTAFYIGLTDYDTPDPDDFIGWSSPFTLSSYTTYPPTVTLTASNGITITLDIQWQ